MLFFRDDQINACAFTWARSEMYSVGFEVQRMKGASSKQPWMRSDNVIVIVIFNKNVILMTIILIVTSNFAKIWMILLPWLWMFSRMTTEGSLRRGSLSSSATLFTHSIYIWIAPEVPNPGVCIFANPCFTLWWATLSRSAAQLFGFSLSPNHGVTIVSLKCLYSINATKRMPKEVPRKCGRILYVPFENVRMLPS